MKQLEVADKKLFTLLAEAREGIKSQTKGKPCDLVFDKCFEPTEVRHLLQPLPMSGAAASNQGGNKLQRMPPGEAAPSPKQPRPVVRARVKERLRNSNAFLMICCGLGRLPIRPKAIACVFSYNLKHAIHRQSNRSVRKVFTCVDATSCHKARPVLECPAKKSEPPSQEIHEKPFACNAKHVAEALE